MQIENKTLYRLEISEDDIKECIDFIKAAEKFNADSIEYEALMISAIIFYARPFSSNEISKSANADSRIPEDSIQTFSTKEMALHDRILDRRNKAIAHAEWNEFPVSARREGTTVVGSRSRYNVYPEFGDRNNFLALAEKLLAILSGKIINQRFPSIP